MTRGVPPSPVALWSTDGLNSARVGSITTCAPARAGVDKSGATTSAVRNAKEAKPLCGIGVTFVQHRWGWCRICSSARISRGAQSCSAGFKPRTGKTETAANPLKGSMKCKVEPEMSRLTLQFLLCSDKSHTVQRGLLLLQPQNARSIFRRRPARDSAVRCRTGHGCRRTGLHRR